MSSFNIKRMTILPALALASVALALPLASQAAGTTGAEAPAAPHVGTGGAHASGTSTVLQGTINPHNLATTYYFQYGPTATYGSQTAPASLPAGATTVKVQQVVTGILPGYHYRLVASNAKGKRLGHDHVFNTAASKKKPAFALPKTYEPTLIGDAFVLNGTLTGLGNGNRAIVLQESPYPYTAAYVNVGSPILTSSTGHFSFRVADLRTSTKFRVSTVNVVPLRSPIVPEQVSVRVILKVRRSSQKGLVRLYGTVTPAEVGARVFFQLEKAPKGEGEAGRAPKTEKLSKLENPAKKKKSSEKTEKGPTFSTKFSAVVKPGTRAISRFSAIVNVRDTGNYRAYVAIGPGPLASGHSTGILLHAPESNKKKKKKSA
jgi:hypothetical protein